MDHSDLPAVSAAVHNYRYKAVRAVKFLLTSSYLLYIFGLLHLVKFSSAQSDFELGCPR